MEAKHVVGGLGVQIECEFCSSMVCNENITKVYILKNTFSTNINYE